MPGARLPFAVVPFFGALPFTPTAPVQVPTITGTPGVWTNVTPEGLSLDQNFSEGVNGNIDDNFGVLDVVADPVTPGTFYVCVCYQGLWWTQNYGLTWAKRSANGGPMDFGKNWTLSIAPDASYMIAGSGNNEAGTPEYRLCVLRSTDGGITWVPSASLGDSVYDVHICPFDKTKAICSLRSNDDFAESDDEGVTWTNRGSVGTDGEFAGGIRYVHNADTFLYCTQGLGKGVFRCTKSGGVWTCAQVATLTNAEKSHGLWGPWRDPVTGRFYHPAAPLGGNDGIHISDDDALTFTKVNPTALHSSCIIGTATKLYSMWGFPIGASTINAEFSIATRADGEDWSASVNPADEWDMTNGPKTFAAATDGIRWVIIAGAWNAGIWRYVEAEV